MRLHGKRLLVTGATGGLGARLVNLFAAEGAELALSARDPDRLAALATPTNSPTPARYAVDLAVPGAASALVAAVAQDGPIDGLILAHGAVAFGAVGELPAEVSGRLIGLNFLSVTETIRAALPALRESAARASAPAVLTISGIIAELPTLGMADYGASKAALLAWLKPAARELRREKIRLLDARPPHTETGLAERALAGVAPAFAAGKDPDQVAARMAAAYLGDETDLPASAFEA